MQKIFLKIYYNIKDFSSNKKTIVTLGTFDGVHIGHQQILKKITEISASNDIDSVVLTFFPHPRNVVNNEEIKLLNTISEKKTLLNDLQIDHFIIHPFDKLFSELNPEEFVKYILINQFNISKIVIGHDHRFGKNRAANIDDLRKYGGKYNFEVLEISAQQIQDVNVSSTRIRNALGEGNVSLANKYLGYNYSISGKVIYGKQLGRTINFPTANIEIDEKYKLIPKNGVYIVQSHIDNKLIYGMMNIGTKPTFGANEISIEVYFLDFNQDLYGKELQVEFLEFIRNEFKFDGIDSLKKQIEEDLNYALKFISLK